MLNVKQIAVIGLVIVLVAALFSLDIKGLVKEDKAEVAASATEQKTQVSIETISKTAKQSLNASLAKEIEDLEQAFKNADEAEKLNIIKDLAQKWDDVNQPAPAAFYNELIAQAKPDYAIWLKTGDSFTAAYQATQDTLIQPNLVQKAIAAYQEALKLNTASLDAKTGLGMAYVNGTPNPMQGITLLLDVVKQDPKNVKANTNLGLFSMRSGQFDKAVARFKTVIEKQPDPEVWFYLASSYENLGQNEEAILAYEKSKGLAADPGLTKFVDEKINALKK